MAKLKPASRIKSRPVQSRRAIPTEHAEQVALFDWLRLAHPKVVAFAIPNGGARHIVTARKLKAEGVTPGVPDVMIAHPVLGWAGMFVEMKRSRGGRVSPEQEAMRARLVEAGYDVRICAGFDAARSAIEHYLSKQ